LSNEVINWALDQEIVSNAPRKFILVLLANRADDAWECWPSARRVAKESGLSVDQVRRHIRDLEADGYIKRIPWQRDDGGQGSNGYILGNNPEPTPYALTRRGGGHVRTERSAPMPSGPGRGRRAKNPQAKPTEKPIDFAAREESRRRSSTKAADEMTMPTIDELCLVIRESTTRRSDAYDAQIQTIGSRAPKLWREASEKAIKQFKENEPEKVKDPAAVNALAYQYVIHMRAPNWPAWLLGPLLPFVEATKAT
jgi:hypothetical protein